MANKCTGCCYWRPLNGIMDANKQLRACHYALEMNRLLGCRPEECDKYKPKEDKR